MNWELLADPLFRLPFVAGLLVALVLPLVGVLLRLRDEWLAALGLAHLAGSGGLVGMALGLPAVAGALFGACMGALFKTFGRFRGNTAYALMILLGWSLTLLVAANTALGSVMGHALVEGQLYFSGWPQLLAAIGLGLLALLGIPWLMPRLIRARLLLGSRLANGRVAWHWHLAFDLLVAIAMAVGTGTLGLMGAFGLVFVPPWLAFRLAGNWRWTLALSLGIGLGAYLGAFVSALLLDQPFGPMLVAMLLLLSFAFLAGGRLTDARQGRADG